MAKNKFRITEKDFLLAKRKLLALRSVFPAEHIVSASAWTLSLVML